MTVIEAVQAWKEHYEEIDGSYGDAEVTHRLLAIPREQAERIVAYLMVPDSNEDSPRDHMDYSPEEYQGMLEPISDPVEAGKIVHEWILVMNQAVIDDDAAKEFFKLDPEARGEYEDPKAKRFPR